MLKLLNGNVDIHFLTDKRVYGSELVIEIKDDDHFFTQI